MAELGRLLIGFGLLLVLAGAALWLIGRSGFRGLPGDIRVEGPAGGFYFPIVTCLVISVVATLLMWLWQVLTRR